MEFVASEDFSRLIKVDEASAELITSEDVSNMLRNIYLHDIHSHFIVTPDGTYDDTLSMSTGVIPGQVERLEKAHHEGCTIVIKDLENWNEKIKKRCAEFTEPTNVHLYLSPANGSGFGWHTDDRDVYVHGQIGEKSFLVKEPDGKISEYKITKGDVLYIPYGAKHQALPTEVASVHLSFGVWPKKMTIQKQYQNFEIPIQLNI
jgi:hypothetical protein